MSLLDRISRGRVHRPMRNVIYGVEGVGKSSFAAEFPGSITLAAEDGTAHIDTARFVPASLGEAQTFCSELHAAMQAGGSEYQTLNVDSAGWLENLCARSVCQREGVPSITEIPYGRWKKLWSDEFDGMLQWFNALYGVGMNINIIGHALVMPFKNPEGEDYDRFVLQMERPELSERVRQWADNVLFMNFDTFISEISTGGMQKQRKAASMGKRIMHTQRVPAFDAKNRYQLPARIDMGDSSAAGFNEFMTHYNKWVAENIPQPTDNAA